MFKMLVLLRNKLLVLVVAGAVILGGTTVVLAATMSGQQGAHSPTAAHLSATATATAGHRSDDDQKGDDDKDTDKDTEGQNQSCSGQEVQDFLQHFRLATTKNSAAVQAVCALHAGTFKGTSPKGAAVSSSQKFRFEEIAQLFLLAQSLAMKDGVKLNDTNVTSYLASAVQTCSTFSSTSACLKNTLPNMQSDHGGE